MRHVILGFALVVVVGGTAFAQEPAPWLAARQCEIKPTEGPALRAALREFIDYVVANPMPLPGSVLGAYRQRVWGDPSFTVVYEVESIAEWWARDSGNRELNRQDERRGELWAAIFSHTVPDSCQTSFHQRWP